MCSRAAGESARVSACVSCIRARSVGAVITTPVTAWAFSHQQFDTTDRTPATEARGEHLPDHLEARRRHGFAVEEARESWFFDAVATIPAAAVVDEQRPVDERAVGDSDVVDTAVVVGREHPDLEWVLEVVQVGSAVGVDAEHASARWDCVDTFFGGWCVDCHGLVDRPDPPVGAGGRLLRRVFTRKGRVCLLLHNNPKCISLLFPHNSNVRYEC